MLKLKKPCTFCGERMSASGHVCEKCMREIIKYSHGSKCIHCGRVCETGESGVCGFCKKVKPKYTLAFAVFSYKSVYAEAVVGLKYRNEYFRIAGMAELMTELILKQNVNFDCIVYVPSAFETFWRRDYCVPQEIAYKLSKKFKVPFYNNYLLKKSGITSQTLVDFEKRYTNIKGAFYKNPLCRADIKDKTVLLVDDVITTGSTVSECADVLKKHGAKYVYVAALAYGSSVI